MRSRGWTTMVVAMPDVKPAIVSMREGGRRGGLLMTSWPGGREVGEFSDVDIEYTRAEATDCTIVFAKMLYLKID